jgi:hypothetical protein
MARSPEVGRALLVLARELQVYEPAPPAPLWAPLAVSGGMSAASGGYALFWVPRSAAFAVVTMGGWGHGRYRTFGD